MVDNYVLLNQKLGIYDNFNIVFENKIITSSVIRCIINNTFIKSKIIIIL